MDPTAVAVRVCDWSSHLLDAVSPVLRRAARPEPRHTFWLLLIALTALTVPTSLWAQQPDATSLLQPETLHNIPIPGPITIDPRVFSAYGALIAAAMLSMLYLYRGRAFIVYWVGSWLLVAAALGLVSRVYSDPTLGSALTGLSMLFVVWSSGLVLLAARAFPQNPLRWGAMLKGVAASAALFLVAPFVLPGTLLVYTGTAVTGGLLGWAAVRYLQLARHARFAGAFLIGAGLLVICSGNLLGAAIAFTIGADVALSRLAAVNVVTSMFVALGMHLLVFEDMTEELRLTNRDLAAANEEVKRLAITDPLTGCHNRRFFDEIERREMQRHRRYASPLSVVFVDVNHFKRLNDTLGHDRGDETLRAIGELLRRQIRESDYVIRWGGDEFLLLMTCSEEEAQAKAADLKAAFERERATAALPDQVGLSVGIASVSKGADTLRDAIRDADRRMYRDKQSERASL
jgi:diguanylate cyclase (GGDEF)-like protein